MWRGILGAGGATAVIVVRSLRRGDRHNRMPRVPGGLWRLGVLGLLAGPVFVLGLNVAVAEVGATVAGFLTGLYAVFAASMAPAILREPLERSVLGGLVMALVGTAMLASIGIADADMYGTGAGLVASLGYAFYLVLGRKWSGPYRLRPALIALAAAALTGVAFLTWLLHTDPGVIWPESPRTDSLVALGWLALVMIGGQTLVMVSARRSATRRLKGSMERNVAPEVAGVNDPSMKRPWVCIMSSATAPVVVGMSASPRSRTSFPCHRAPYRARRVRCRSRPR